MLFPLVPSPCVQISNKILPFTLDTSVTLLVRFFGFGMGNAIREADSSVAEYYSLAKLTYKTTHHTYYILNKCRKILCDWLRIVLVDFRP